MTVATLFAARDLGQRVCRMNHSDETLQLLSELADGEWDPFPLLFERNRRALSRPHKYLS